VITLCGGLALLALLAWAFSGGGGKAPSAASKASQASGSGRRPDPLVAAQDGGERLADVVHLLHLHQVGEAVGALQGRA
jgi:hypothetical protein